MKKNKYIRFLKKYCNLNKKGKVRTSKFLYLLNRILFSNDIPPTVEFGENLNLPHYGLGVVIHPRAKLGDNVTIYQNVTIGCRNKMGPPIIGNNVLIGAGACILGKIKIGDNVQIGANAVVTKNIENNDTVVGIPAHSLKKKGENNDK